MAYGLFYRAYGDGSNIGHKFHSSEKQRRFIVLFSIVLEARNRDET